MKTCRFITFSSIFGVLLAISSIATADLKTGLVAYYPFNGNANDESGNGNNGTVNGATLTTDRFGNVNSAYSFDGSNTDEKRIEIANNSSFNFNTSFSIAFWYKPNSSGLSNRGIVGKWGSQGGADNSSAWVFVSDNKTIYFHVITASQKYASTSTVLVDNSWYSIVGIYDGQKIMIYLNGVLEGSTPQSGGLAYGTSNIGIGNYAWTESANNVINGAVDQVRIYNRALSTSEIQQLYQEGTTNYLDVTAIPDVNGDGLMDQAVLTQSAGKYYLRTINGANGKQLKSLSLGTAAGVTLSGLTVIPDINGDGAVDFALLVLSGGNYSLRVVDGVTGNQLRQVSLGAATGLTPIALTVVDDANANTYKDISILIKNADGSNVLQIRDGLMLSVLKTFKLK